MFREFDLSPQVTRGSCTRVQRDLLQPDAIDVKVSNAMRWQCFSINSWTLEYRSWDSCALLASQGNHSELAGLRHMQYVPQTSFNWKFQRGAHVVAVCPGIRMWWLRELVMCLSSVVSGDQYSCGDMAIGVPCPGRIFGSDF